MITTHTRLFGITWVLRLTFQFIMGIVHVAADTTCISLQAPKRRVKKKGGGGVTGVAKRSG